MKVLSLDDIRFDGPIGRVKSPKPPREKRKIEIKGRFVRGPIPTEWLIKASLAGGSSLTVGLILWHLSGLNRGARTVLLTTVVCKQWGVAPAAKQRALATLENASLVSIERRGKKNPIVTILRGGDEHD
jgi:hypothetical protein